MSHYLQLTASSSDSCMRPANMVRCQAAAYAAWRRLPDDKAGRDFVVAHAWGAGPERVN